MASEYEGSILCSQGLRFRNTQAGAASADKYHMTNVVSIPESARRVIVGGKVGVRDGKVPTDLKEEIDLAFENVELSLRAAGLENNPWEYVYKVNSKQYPLLYQN